MTPLIAWLTEEHRDIEALLDAAGRGEPVDEAAFEALRARLLRHIAVEEKVLFPAARAARGAPLTWARHLRLEHAAISTLLVPTPDAELVGELRALLARHDAREEGPGGVYEECEAALGGGWPDVLARMKAFPPVKVARHFDGPGIERTARGALRRAGAADDEM